MKKVIAIVAIAALTACGGTSTPVATTDSTVKTVDTTGAAGNHDTTYYKNENADRKAQIK
jgi:ABC-type glycerol-3-phosphate transport system substrate-binding protein